jgi:serine protein kinase
MQELNELSKKYKKNYCSQKMLLSFQQYLNLVKQNSHLHIRDSSTYLFDTIEYFKNSDHKSIFNLDTDTGGPIVNNEHVQKDLIDIITNFKNRDMSDKLILIYGPSGSGKSSTIEKISKAMELYSRTDAGSIYCFNWIFPLKNQRSSGAHLGENQSIGFHPTDEQKNEQTYAFYDDNKIQSKIYSNFRENPLFLLPKDIRITFLKNYIHNYKEDSPKESPLPKHMQKDGLSQKNQQIFTALLNVYKGNLLQVLSHIQVERFFFSQQYQIGIANVSPQMSIDAFDKQITLDKSYSNLPAALQNINFYDISGELVHANRGILEFSDLLKRPVESFKYLLNTIEKNHIKLSSGLETVDTVYLATTNDKQLDMLKANPEFSSFQGRFEFISSPYIRKPSQEIKIYQQDIECVNRSKSICPHTIELLCLWASLTRLKRPEAKQYPQKFQELIEKLDPLSKIRLYEKQNLQPKLSKKDQEILYELRPLILNESRQDMLYEGRFGFSPRNMRSFIHKLSQDTVQKDITPIDLFNSLAELAKKVSIHEFLRIEPMDHYHNSLVFIEYIKDSFYYSFKKEITLSISGTNEEEYNSYLKKYIEHAISYSKTQDINISTIQYPQTPSMDLLNNVEAILKIGDNIEDHRSSLLSRIAAYRLENPDIEVDLCEVFSDYLKTIKIYFYNEQQESTTQQIKSMLTAFENKELYNKSSQKILLYYQNMQTKFSYTFSATYTCLKFFLKHRIKHHLFTEE